MFFVQILCAQSTNTLITVVVLPHPYHSPWATESEYHANNYYNNPSIYGLLNCYSTNWSEEIFVDRKWLLDKLKDIKWVLDKT